MIHEIAYIEIAPEHAAAFEAAVAEAALYFRAAQGCRSFRLERIIEQPSHYRLVVGWDRVEDHMVTFRNSDGFQRWRELAGPYFATPPRVEHVETVVDVF
jgi:quinol monooxygenase YgiN